MDRKSFISGIGRWSLFAVLAGLVYFMIRNRNVASGNSCAENEFCRSCKRFGSCNLPQAIEQS